MKKYVLILMICTLVSWTFTLHIKEVKGKEEDASLINSFEKDMTGDGFQEYIRLQGDVLSNSSTFYQDVWLTVQNNFKNEWSVSLQHGYKPELSLIDLTGDNNPDVFYQIAKDEQLEHFHYQLYSFAHDKIHAIDLPTHQYAKVAFADDFTLKVNTNPSKKPITLDLSDKKDLYIEENVYQRNGTSTKEFKPEIDRYGTMEPMLLSESKGYGLKTIHHIHGMDEDDLIARLETIWHFEKNHWINVKTEVVAER